LFSQIFFGGIVSAAPPATRQESHPWAIAAAIVGLLFLNRPIFFVDQTELANVRRFGNVL
jgi:hypothetical protein